MSASVMQSSSSGEQTTLSQSVLSGAIGWLLPEISYLCATFCVDGFIQNVIELKSAACVIKFSTFFVF